MGFLKRLLSAAGQVVNEVQERTELQPTSNPSGSLPSSTARPSSPAAGAAEPVRMELTLEGGLTATVRAGTCSWHTGRSGYGRNPQGRAGRLELRLTDLRGEGDVPRAITIVLDPVQSSNGRYQFGNFWNRVTVEPAAGRKWTSFKSGGDLWWRAGQSLTVGPGRLRQERDHRAPGVTISGRVEAPEAARAQP